MGRFALIIEGKTINELRLGDPAQISRVITEKD